MRYRRMRPTRKLNNPTTHKLILTTAIATPYAAYCHTQMSFTMYRMYSFLQRVSLESSLCSHVTMWSRCVTSWYISEPRLTTS